MYYIINTILRAIVSVICMYINYRRKVCVCERETEKERCYIYVVYRFLKHIISLVFKLNVNIQDFQASPHFVLYHN